MLTSLNIKGKIFIFYIFPKIFPIETRVPFLDVNLIDNLVPMSSFRKFGYKFSSKNLLKKLFKNDIHSLVKQKWGLQSPLAKWMKKPLQNYIKEILSPQYYDSSHLLNFDNIQT